MPPFYSSYDDPPTGFINGLTPLIMQITMIGIVARSFFQPAESIIMTVVTLLSVGLLFDVAQRVLNFLTSALINRLKTEKSFEEGTVEYQWIMSFLVGKHKWPGSCGRPFEMESGKHTSSFWWSRTWVKVGRFEEKGAYYGSFGQQNEGPKPYIDVTIYGLRSSAMSKLLQKAKQQYSETRHHTVTVYSPVHNNPAIANNQQNWANKKEMPARLLDSTSLSVQTLTSLIEEARNFFDSETWHNEVGIPWQKRYLLHGPAGSGKRDAVLAVAGKLGRAVYSITLTSTGNTVDNNCLLSAMASVPKGSIFLLENIDLAFEWPSYTSQPNNGFQPYVTFQLPTSYGVFKMLDTAARQEGVLLFATATKIGNIDEAIFQSGRIDKKIEFGHVTKEQAGRLFSRFFANNNYKDYDTSPSDKKSMQPGDLADAFSSCIPDNELALAQVRSYLLKHQSSPMTAVANVRDWVKEVLDERAKRIEQEAAAERMRLEAKKAMEQPVMTPLQRAYTPSYAGYPQAPSWGSSAVPIIIPPMPWTPSPPSPRPIKLEDSEDDMSEVASIVEESIVPSK